MAAVRRWCTVRRNWRSLWSIFLLEFWSWNRGASSTKLRHHRLRRIDRGRALHSHWGRYQEHMLYPWCPIFRFRSRWLLVHFDLTISRCCLKSNVSSAEACSLRFRQIAFAETVRRCTTVVHPSSSFSNVFGIVRRDGVKGICTLLITVDQCIVVIRIHRFFNRWLIFPIGHFLSVYLLF